jgi:hypothetical protein
MYRLRAETTFIKGNPPPQSPTVVPASSEVYVTVRNGFYVVMDADKTYAKVISPAEGFVASNANDTFTFTFTFRTDHKITWRRYEACGEYLLPVRFRQDTSWRFEGTRKDIDDEYALPKVVDQDSGTSGTVTQTIVVTGVVGRGIGQPMPTAMGLDIEAILLMVGVIFSPQAHIIGALPFHNHFH